MDKVLYLNGWRGRIEADMGLQLGAHLRVDVVVIAEALAAQERRNQYGKYDLKVNIEYLGIYTRKDREITCSKRGTSSCP